MTALDEPALDNPEQQTGGLVDADRLDHYRGPGRGDGWRRRSIEWHRQHDEALTRPCPYEVPKPSELPDGVWRCGADVGEDCVSFPDRGPLGRQAAHNMRIFPKYARSAETSDEDT